MEILEKGEGELIGWHDPDEARKWVKEKKSRELKDKRMNLDEAVRKYVHHGDILAMGGFGHVRVSFAAVYEIIRQKIRDLTFIAKTGVHDSDLLIGSGCVSKIEVAYAFGHELRGLSPASRRAVETGKVRVIGETSNAGHQWRFLAAAMGLPFIPTRVMLGTDTLKKSPCIVVTDPFSKKPIALLPALYPDVVFIHVPRSDKYGNAQIDGILVEDFELARAARRLIITTERIIDNEEIRKKPWRTVIPFMLVDAVVEVPWGAHPVQMPYMYSFDEEHISLWLQQSKTDTGIQEYLDTYVFGTKDHAEYLEAIGGEKRLQLLQDIELAKAPMEAPWLKKK